MPEHGASKPTWRKYLAPRQLAVIFGETLAWAWAILAGGGGFGLILTEGPWPLTHGWYAMFSGMALCPATAWLLRRTLGVQTRYVARFAVAALFLAAGRLALLIGPWPIGPH